MEWSKIHLNCLKEYEAPDAIKADFRFKFTGLNNDKLPGEQTYCYLCIKRRIGY